MRKVVRNVVNCVVSLMVRTQIVEIVRIVNHYQELVELYLDGEVGNI